MSNATDTIAEALDTLRLLARTDATVYLRWGSATLGKGDKTDPMSANAAEGLVRALGTFAPDMRVDVYRVNS